MDYFAFLKLAFVIGLATVVAGFLASIVLAKRAKKNEARRNKHFDDFAETEINRYDK